MFIQNRAESRAFFYNVWKKQKSRLSLDPLEVIIFDVISTHPEYHCYLDDEKSIYQNDSSAENDKINPFLHMGMHIALKEQINSNKPVGINVIFSKVVSKSVSVHDAEHKMMECLGKSLWKAQLENKLPDENEYLECLENILQ
jgi:hypothetical protein